MVSRSSPRPVSIPDELEGPLRAWRTEHPDATLAEIERGVDGQLAAVRAAMIQQAATTVPEETEVRCPACGERMHRNGKRTVTQTTRNEGTLRLTGADYRCPACGAGLFPPR